MQPQLTRQKSQTARLIADDPRYLLQRMDVFLTSHKGNFISSLICRSSNCFFSHAAATFLVPDHDAGFEHVFVMEAFGRGVEVRNAEKYFSFPKAYDYAIVRLKAPWIGGPGNVAEDLRKLARGRMLEHIEASYDKWRFLKIGWDILFRRPAYVLQNYRERTRSDRSTPFVRSVKTPDEFVCSSFVSYAFYETAVKKEASDNAPGRYVPDTLFHPAFANGVPPGMSQKKIEDFVLSTSPADLVRSDRFDWRWMVVKGKPLRVSSRDEALAYVRKVYGPKINF